MNHVDKEISAARTGDLHILKWWPEGLFEEDADFSLLFASSFLKKIMLVRSIYDLAGILGMP